MARLLSRNPSPRDEWAYRFWLDHYSDYRCDRCDAYVPEAHQHVHDVTGKPKRVYCSEYCYHAHNDTGHYRMGGV